MSPLRRLLPLALVAAGVVAVLLVAGLSGADGGWISSWWRGSSDEAAGEDLLARAAAVPETTGGPTLRAAATKPHETHGPVTVTVVDRAGAPVEGVCVRALVLAPPDAQGQIAEERREQGATDPSGRARFADLPYDGRAVVRAVARKHAADGDAAQDWDVQITSGVNIQLRNGDSVVALDGDRRALLVSGSPQDPDAGSDASPPGSTALLEAAVRAGLFRILSADTSEDPTLAEAQVTGPEVRLVIDRGLPLRLAVREAGDGRVRGDARWQVRPRLAWADDAYGAATLPLTPGKPASIACRVEAPRGLVARKEAQWNVLVHPLAQRLEAVYPLRPALDVILVVPREAMPYRAEDWEGTVEVAGIALQAPDLHVDAQGRLLVRGGAHLVGDRVSVNGKLANRFLASGEGYIGPDPHTPVVIDLKLTPLGAPPGAPETPGDTPQVFDFQFETMTAGGQVSVSGGDGVRLRIANVLRDGVMMKGRWGLEAVDPKEQYAALKALQLEMAEAERLEASKALLPVRVVAWHGGPAAGALLRLGDQELMADAAGRATFRDVPDGATWIRVLGAGAAASLTIDVGPRPRPEAVLTASAGGTLEVEVVDSEGRGLPYAHVDLQQAGDLPWMDCVDGTQRLDPYTDVAGWRTFRFVAPGTLTVKAYFGTRSAEVKDLVVLDGDTHTVRLVLPVLKPAPPPAPPATDPATAR